ncbi:glycoside hydrolase family 43 protein [Peniophora sp. CONT]|nr:glycoside hydrolase family 43 protein [Peniophora sp. CONT]
MLFFAALFTLVPLSVCAAALSKRSINGPVITANFPDPAILTVDGTYYVFSTTGAGKHVPVQTSTDFVNWTPLPDALPTVGNWSTGHNVWAPDVIQLGTNSFLMYYSAEANSNPVKHCVSAATSSSPAGPYTPIADVLACPISAGGAIDPAAFLDTDGSLYLAWKVDGNSIGHGGNCGNSVAPIVPTPIIIQKMTSNGTAFAAGSSATQILDRSDADGPLVEAPSLVEKDGTYFLFFSSNCYSGSLYDVSYATASSVLGPYTKSATPLLKTGSPYAQLFSPGGLDISRDGTRAVFHADFNKTAHVRQMYTAAVNISDKTVTI